MPHLLILGCNMRQTIRSTQPTRTPRPGTLLGLLSCAAALLLTGVVIGRVTAAEGNGGEQVYLHFPETQPSTAVTPAGVAEHTSRSAERWGDRPPLDPVRRTPASTPSARATRTPAPRATSEAGGPDGGGTVVHAHSAGEEADGPHWDATGHPELEREVLRLVNLARVAHGCRRLRLDPRLVRSARRHAAQMAASGRFSHTWSDGTTAWDRMAAADYPDGAAETIARGYRSAEAVVAGWMARKADRRTLLDCRIVAAGIGVSIGPTGYWWTGDFGYS